ncbi:MAG: hypothetical protein WBH03_03165, partial [Cyclobacteriaceae bacterium]
MKNIQSFGLLLLTFCFLSGFQGCEKDDIIVCFPEETCNVSDPLNELPFLKEKKVQLEQSQTQADISSYTYNGETVFVVNNCNGCADALTVAYDCEGNTVCEWGGIMGLNT